MKNDFWIFVKRKNYLELVIDIYDANYMDQSREERFAELKSLLENEIMEIKKVYINWENSGYLLELNKSWIAIERIVKIHELLEEAYTWLTPYDRNPVLENDSLQLDERFDNTHLQHYKVKRKKNEVHMLIPFFYFGFILNGISYFF